MGFLHLLYRHGHWIGILALGLFGFSLFRCIAGVVRTERQSRLHRLSLLASQEVELAGAGPVVLSIEGPVLGRRPAGLGYELVGPDGAAVASRRIVFGSRTSGMARETTDVRVFEVAAPGRHLLRVTGMAPGDASHGAWRVILSRPHLAASLGWVVGIVLSSVLTIGSLVLFVMRVAGVGLQSP